MYQIITERMKANAKLSFIAEGIILKAGFGKDKNIIIDIPTVEITDLYVGPKP